MTNVFEIGLSNAAAATVLALAVWLVTRVWRHPVLAHTLWLIVLVKLLMPPMLTIPWRLHNTAPMDVTLKPRAESLSAIVASPSDTQQAGSTQPRGDETQRSAIIAFDGVAEQGNTLNRLTMPLATPHLRGNQHSPARLSFVPSWSILVMTAWSIGSVGFLVVTVSRLARFHRALVASAAAPDSVQQMAADLASRLGVANRFRLRVTEGCLSPLVWPVGRPTILLPRGLLNDMPPPEIRSLLAHEFAHLCRRDHWVRWLELMTATLYWWHPVVWWSRREMQWAEEEACDAWVIAALPGQQTLYATALFNARQFTSNYGRRTPLMSSALGSNGNLKTRIEHIMNATWKPRLLPHVRLSVLLAALLVLPLSMRVVHATNENAVQNDASASPSASDAANADATFVEGHDDVNADANTFIAAPKILPPDVSDDARSEPGERDSQTQNETAASTTIDANRGEANATRIQPGMALLIRVVGTAPDHPIADAFAVEPGGTVALGPMYGRVRVENLTVAEAEAALVDHLQTTLKNPRVQVILESRMIERRRVPLPKGTYQIEPGDVLAVWVANAFPEWPIADEYLVEPNGTLALGPFYGRVKVADLSLESAEKAVAEHLEKQITDPKVQVTLGGWRSAATWPRNAMAIRRSDEVAHSADQNVYSSLNTTATTATTATDHVLKASSSAEEIAELRRRIVELEGLHHRDEESNERNATDDVSAAADSLAILKVKAEMARQSFDRLRELASKNVVSTNELQRAKGAYEISVLRIRQAERVLKYHRALLAVAEADYQQLVETNKRAPNSITAAELRRAELAVELAKAKLEALVE